MFLRIINILALIGALSVAPCAADNEIHYEISIDNSLTTMRVEAHFETPVFSLNARDDAASRYLGGIEDCDRDLPLHANGRRLEVPNQGLRCVVYRVDLARLSSDDRRNGSLHPDNRVVEPARWLLLPSLDDAAIDLHFANADVPVSVPWQPLAERRFRLPPSPGSGHAVMAYGAFEVRERRVGDQRLHIALLRTSDDYRYDGLADWLQGAAENVASAYGRFPESSPQILVVPVGDSGWGGGKAVPFARVLRDGGDAIEFFVNESASLDAFRRDWTATHEFSHLLLPYVTYRQRWVSEGFAQYYQNVLLARAGVYTENEAWSRLVAGFERGRGSRPDLSPNAAAASRASGSRMKIYWSGAVLALRADVELRRRSGGRRSLDTVLDELESCCMPSARVWQATELFAALDALLDEPLFVPLYEDVGMQPGFPEVAPLLSELGVPMDKRGALDDTARLSGIRRAITGHLRVAAGSAAR